MSKYSHFEMCEKIFGQKYKWNEQKHDYKPYSRTDMWNKMIEQQDKISDLEAKLVECEKSKESYRLQNEQHHLQLLQFYSRLGVEAFGADIHEKALETLMIMKEQLAEKEKEISDILAKQSITCLNTIEKAYQDKISFGIEQLEKVKETFIWGKDNGYLTPENAVNIIDNQIKQLKEY